MKPGFLDRSKRVHDYNEVNNWEDTFDLVEVSSTDHSSLELWWCPGISTRQELVFKFSVGSSATYFIIMATLVGSEFYHCILLFVDI